MRSAQERKPWSARPDCLALPSEVFPENDICRHPKTVCKKGFFSSLLLSKIGQYEFPVLVDFCLERITLSDIRIESSYRSRNKNRQRFSGKSFQQNNAPFIVDIRQLAIHRRGNFITISGKRFRVLHISLKRQRIGLAFGGLFRFAHIYKRPCNHYGNQRNQHSNYCRLIIFHIY